MNSQQLWLAEPNSSQPVLQSIEEQASLVWQQPLRLLSQQLAHQSSPDWQSRASTAISEASSQPTPQTPRARPIATPRRPSTLSHQLSAGPVSPPTEQLTKADHIYILRLAIDNGAA
jgi:hypothetical protein